MKMRTRSRSAARRIGGRLTTTTVALALGAVAGCSGGSESSQGAVIVWHGYTDNEAAAFTQLGREWNQAHPDQTNWPVLMAGTVTSQIPVLMLFLIAQRFFVRSIASSGLR
jgi:ABC-type glycerol-3-phosphate transport system substrate-binding protein